MPISPAAPPCAPAPKPCLDALPEELKLVILQQSGPNPYTLHAMQRVNRDWYRLVQDDSLWAPLCPKPCEPAKTPEASQSPDSSSQDALLAPLPRFRAYLAQQPKHVRVALRALWHPPVVPHELTAASANPLFVCHAELIVLPEPARLKWRWSPLHPANRLTTPPVACRG